MQLVIYADNIHSEHNDCGPQICLLLFVSLTCTHTWVTSDRLGHQKAINSWSGIKMISTYIFVAISSTIAFEKTYPTVVADGSLCISVCLSVTVCLSFCLLLSGPSPHYVGLLFYCCPNTPSSQSPNKKKKMFLWMGNECKVNSKISLIGTCSNSKDWEFWQFYVHIPRKNSTRGWMGAIV